MNTYSTRSNARAAARQAAAAAGITAPLAGVHFDVTEPSEAPGRFAYFLMDTKTGEKVADPSAAFDDAPHGEPIGTIAIADVNDTQGVVNAVEAALPELAAKAWDKHPNNPLNKPEPVTEVAAPVDVPARKPRADAGTSKKAIVLAMLASPEGATVTEIAARTDWLQHTTRAFIAVTPKKLGLTVTSEKVAERGRVYRATPAIANTPTAAA